MLRSVCLEVCAVKYPRTPSLYDPYGQSDELPAAIHVRVRVRVSAKVDVEVIDGAAVAIKIRTRVMVRVRLMDMVMVILMVSFCTSRITATDRIKR